MFKKYYFHYKQTPSVKFIVYNFNGICIPSRKDYNKLKTQTNPWDTLEDLLKDDDVQFYILVPSLTNIEIFKHPKIKTANEIHKILKNQRFKNSFDKLIEE